MKYCMKCGISVDETEHPICPLCQTVILNDDELELLSRNRKRPLKKEKFLKPKKDKKNWMGFTSISIVFASVLAIAVLLIIDLLIRFNLTFSVIPILSILLFLLTVGIPFMRWNKSIFWYISFDSISLILYVLAINYYITHSITWSYYVVLTLFLIWIYLSSVFIHKVKGFILKITINFLATAFFVLLVTYGLNNESAFSRLALPINGLVFILMVIGYLFIKTYWYNWKIIVSTTTISLSILCVGVDAFVNHFITHQFTLSWSIIVLFVLIPSTLFMFYLDNHYKINQYFIKKFHI